MYLSFQDVFSNCFCLDFSEGSEDMSHIRTVELQHDTSGSLGLSIAGGLGSNLGDTPVVVANMTPNGPAEKSRKLKVSPFRIAGPGSWVGCMSAWYSHFHRFDPPFRQKILS